MVYDHGQRGLLQTLTDIQHDYMHIVQASLHAHITHNRCLEIILLHGEGSDLKLIAERIMSQRGVESVKLTTIAVRD